MAGGARANGARVTRSSGPRQPDVAEFPETGRAPGLEPSIPVPPLRFPPRTGPSALCVATIEDHLNTIVTPELPHDTASHLRMVPRDDVEVLDVVVVRA